MEKKTDKRVEALKSTLEELNLQLHLGKANTEDLSLRLHDYQVKFDIFKLQLQLAKMESDQEFEKRKAEVAERISEFQSEVEKRASQASDKWEQFSSEMTEAWKHIRKAFD